jgi:AraC family transcriptional regulator
LDTSLKRKTATSLEYQKRIQKALAYIRKNLDKPMTLKDVAKAACFSEFHFHRIFSNIMQEPLGEYITRKKLERAAIRLVYSPGTKVSDLAFEYGYSSVSSFSKAFNQWFGCRPTEISIIKDRLDSGFGKLQSKYEKSIESDQLIADICGQDQEAMFEKMDSQVEIKTISSFKVYYITNPRGYELDSLNQVWLKMVEILEDAKIDINDCERFAISHDHPGLTPQSHCRYDACVRLPDDDKYLLSLATTIVPSGRYVVYRVEGSKKSILSRYLEFCTVWLPQSGYELDNFPVLEHYPLSSCDSNVTVEFWNKVKRLSCL